MDSPLLASTGPIPPLDDFASLRNGIFVQYRRLQESGLPTIDRVFIALLKYSESRRSKLSTLERWAIAKHCGGYTHIELVFEDSNGSVIAYTVNRHDPKEDEKELGRKPKPGERVTGYVHTIFPNMEVAYRRPFWEVKFLGTLTAEERYGLWCFCCRQQGKPMDSWGMYLNFMPVLRDFFIGEPQQEEEMYFCSQLVGSALKWIRPDQFSSVNPRRCTPAALRDLMNRHEEFFIHGEIRPISQLVL